MSNKFREPRVEANDVDLYVVVNDKSQMLKNKDRICDLVRVNLLSKERLTNELPTYYGLWNPGEQYQKEVIYVRIKNFG